MKPAEDKSPTSETSTKTTHSANLGFALAQLAAALKTGRENADPETRERAVKKAEKWVDVIGGMVSGTLNIGSRTPIKETPAWSTPQVVHGGFVTGKLMAGGPLLPHETQLLKGITNRRTQEERAVLNNLFLSEPGIHDLYAWVHSGRYRVEIPEEGALPVIVWLLAHGHVERAGAILDEISPYMNRLRFYPIPAVQPLPYGENVCLQTVQKTIEDLDALKPRPRILAMREAIQVWAPLCDRVVELFLETLEGEAPTVHTDAASKPLMTDIGQFVIVGGWPCQHYPEGWRKRAKTVLDDYRRLRAKHRLCSKPERRGENFTTLRGYLETCVENPSRLTGNDVGCIRGTLAKIAFSRGFPGSERCEALRRFQKDQADSPTTAELGRVVRERLVSHPTDGGLEGAGVLEKILAPVTESEAVRHRVRALQAVEGLFHEKVRRCLSAPIEELVRREIIPSGEVLARVVPPFIARASSAGLADPDLRRLYQVLYQAFQKRRSLLLLNLESQVKFSELPWVRAIDADRERTRETEAAARQALEQISVLALKAFPHQILPNKLIQELQTLSVDAGLRIPFVEEIAVDIFMGTFSAKFVYAAQTAATLLQGTLYERYYGLPYARVLQINDFKQTFKKGPLISPAFNMLCKEMAGPVVGGSYTANNGKIIEQEQILTTHNLAGLCMALGLAEKLRPEWDGMARDCFIWICRQQQLRFKHWRADLQMRKNTAYAWRQMLFFLSLLPHEEVERFYSWALEHLDSQQPGFQQRFSPVLEGLAHAIRGESSDAPPESVRFLGWITGKHGMLE